MEDGEQLEKRLFELACNLWWTWHPDAIEVWHSIDSQLWRESRHSPVSFIKKLGKERLKQLSQDPSLLIKINRLFA